MRTFLTLVIATLAMTSTFHVDAQTYAEHVTLHSESPGTLQITREARVATSLKITGDIDARDFQSLKAATTCTTRELDLSEATIHAYQGTDGCYAELSDDWFISDPESVTYPANYLPVDAFTEAADNSISKYRLASISLRRIVLPRNLQGVMPRSFQNVPYLREIIVPEGSRQLKGDGIALYSGDGNVLLGVAAGQHGHLVVPATATTVAAGALGYSSPASVTFFASGDLTVGEGNSTMSCGYIVTSNPAPLSEIYPSIDCTTPFEELSVDNLVAGTLMERLADSGLTRQTVRALKISGNMSSDDLDFLLGLPNLHKLDMSGATYHGYLDFNISSNALTDLKMPESPVANGQVVVQSAHLCGDLSITEGVYHAAISGTSLRKIVFPASLANFSSGWLYRDPIEEVDFGKCIGLTSLECMEECPFLTKVTLPTGIRSIKKMSGPICEINLPESLEYLIAKDWEVESLTLPSGLEELYCARLPKLRTLDATDATRLYKMEGPWHAPMLEHVDLSATQLQNLSGFEGDHHLNPDAVTASQSTSQKVVVSGGYRYPPKNIIGLKSIELPHSLQTISGFRCCDMLGELDLSHCCNLKSASVCYDCPALERVGLAKITQTTSYDGYIYGLQNCPSLKEVAVASLDAPAAGSSFGDEHTWKAILVVPNGSTGRYRMSERWENFTDIREGGYLISITPSYNEYPHIVLGAGMYQPNQKVKLTALTTYNGMRGRDGLKYVISQWYDQDGLWYFSPEITFDMPDKHLTFTPVYKKDFETPDSEIEITAYENMVLMANAPSGTQNMGCYLYLDDTQVGCRTPYNKSRGKWELSSGVHTLRIYGSVPGNLELGFDPETYEAQTGYAVTGLRSNNIAEPLNLRTSQIDIDVIDATNCGNGLMSLNADGGRINRMDMRGMERLETISLYIDGLRELRLGDHPQLSWLNIQGDNMLTSIHIDNCPLLTDSDVSYFGSHYYVSLDGEGCFDLSELEAYGLDTGRMYAIQLPTGEQWPTLQNKRLQFNPAGPLPQICVYDYDCGRGVSRRFTLCYDGVHSGIQHYITDDTGLRVEGLTVIVRGDVPATAIDMSGRSVATSADGHLVLPAPGPYIICTATSAYKISVH